MIDICVTLRTCGKSLFFKISGSIFFAHVATLHYRHATHTHTYCEKSSKKKQQRQTSRAVDLSHLNY